MTRTDNITVIFISLLHLITVTGVYYVTPDDDQSDINNDCPIDHSGCAMCSLALSGLAMVNA